MTELSQALKERALASGADLVGIAPAKPLPEAAAYLRWVEEGRQGAMEYMARNRRSREDITFWYPEAKSVLVCGFSYADNSKREAPPGQGRLARYAALPDYHPELKRRMQTVLDWFREAAPGSDGRVFVDTSPLLERLYARYAGLGWIGKNTMLIAPRLGSYFFLAGIALNRELVPEEPVPDHCGTCTRCLSACPTEAFPEERVLDASRCIAYFTIEHRGRIPEGFRPGIGSWVMGCDVCQEVCPWNRFALAGPVFERFPARASNHFRPSDTARECRLRTPLGSGLAHPPSAGARARSPALPESIPLEELALMGEDEFKRRFGRTPLSRAKHRGIVRNALLAMGNSGDPGFKPVLERFACHPDPVLSEQAAWSLARLAREPREAEIPAP